MSATIRPGLTATLEFTVTADDTAEAVGSGDLAVLGTPRLLAWFEAATCAAVADELEAGSTSVGTRVVVEHVAASAVGQRVEVTAAVSYTDGRLARFSVAASNLPAQALIGSGEVTRVVVDAERFLARVATPGD